MSFLSRTRSAIFVISPPSPPLLTVNGSSETMIASLPLLIGSMWALARTRTDAAARPVGVADARRAHDRAAAREVGALDVLHQALGVDLRVLDVGLDRADHLAEVVRRDVRRHADGDPRGAVDEQVREPRRQHQRLGQGVVVVRPEVDRLRLDVAEHLGREPGEPGLRVVADESVRDERVVVGVDLDREDGLDAGGLDRGDLGVEVVASDQRRITSLTSSRLDPRGDRDAVAVPSDRPDRCCAGWSQSRSVQLDPDDGAHVVGDERHEVAAHAPGRRSGSEADQNIELASASRRGSRR